MSKGKKLAKETLIFPARDVYIAKVYVSPSVGDSFL